eukprot:714056_1
MAPSIAPSNAPSILPTQPPSLAPSITPSNAPSIAPTQPPSIAPSVAPTKPPSIAPSIAPSNPPSISPTQPPSLAPSITPSNAPSIAPTQPPSIAPSIAPTQPPSPSIAPTQYPSVEPTVIPSLNPTIQSSMTRTIYPSIQPSIIPTTSFQSTEKSLIENIFQNKHLMIVFGISFILFIILFMEQSLVMIFNQSICFLFGYYMTSFQTLHGLLRCIMAFDAKWKSRLGDESDLLSVAASSSPDYIYLFGRIFALRIFAHFYTVQTWFHCMIYGVACLLSTVPDLGNGLAASDLYLKTIFGCICCCIYCLITYQPSYTNEGVFRVWFGSFFYGDMKQSLCIFIWTCFILLSPASSEGVSFIMVWFSSRAQTLYYQVVLCLYLCYQSWLLRSHLSSWICGSLASVHYVRPVYPVYSLFVSFIGQVYSFAGEIFLNYRLLCVPTC